MTRTGWTLSALVLLFLAFDIAIKLLRLPVVVETTLQLGWPATSILPLALVLAASTALYAIPATSVLGAILLTGCLGGAVATHARLGSPLFSHTLFGVYLGILLWAGLYLRDRRVRELIPWRN